MNQKQIRKYLIIMSYQDEKDKIVQMTNDLIDCIDNDITIKELYQKNDCWKHYDYASTL